MSIKFEASKKSGIHSQFQKMTGTWEGTTKTWFEPDKIADESPIHGSIKLLLDGRFLLHEYKSRFGDKPLEGIAIYGYHLETGKFQSAWIDGFHNGTAIMFSEGERGSEEFKMLGGYSYISPETEQKWGWRTEIDIVNDNEIKITAYNISPEGAEARATETLYKRVG